MKSHITLALFFFTLLVSGTAFAAENAASTTDKNEPKPRVRKVVFGILANMISGRWPTVRRSLAPDPNWEVQFNPPEWRWWRWVGSPSPMTGAIPNFTGGTSAFYLGLAWELSLSYEFLNNLTNDFTRRMWVSGGWGPAIHNGPLNKKHGRLQVKRRFSQNDGRMRIWDSSSANAPDRNRSHFLEKSRAVTLRGSHVGRRSFRRSAE